MMTMYYVTYRHGATKTTMYAATSVGAADIAKTAIHSNCVEAVSVGTVKVKRVDLAHLLNAAWASGGLLNFLKSEEVSKWSREASASEFKEVLDQWTEQ